MGNLTGGGGKTPKNANTPPKIQTMAAKPLKGSCSDTTCGFLKTPEPITVPATMAMAIHGPKARTSFEVGAKVGVDDSFMTAQCRRSSGSRTEK